LIGPTDTNLPAQKKRDGFTALHYAALEGYEDIIQLFLSFGVDVGKSGQDCMWKDAGTPLMEAA
jgi:ankyrin repeat protein